MIFPTRNKEKYLRTHLIILLESMETSQQENTINIDFLVEKLQENESLKGKIDGPRGNGCDVIVGSNGHINAVLSVFVNNNVITSFLRLEEQQIWSNPESKMYKSKKYQNIWDLQCEIERLLKEFKRVN